MNHNLPVYYNILYTVFDGVNNNLQCYSSDTYITSGYLQHEIYLYISLNFVNAFKLWMSVLSIRIYITYIWENINTLQYWRFIYFWSGLKLILGCYSPFSSPSRSICPCTYMLYLLTYYSIRSSFYYLFLGGSIQFLIFLVSLSSPLSRASALKAGKPEISLTSF